MITARKQRGRARGVWKTLDLVEAAQLIASGQCPDALKDHRVLSLDHGGGDCRHEIPRPVRGAAQGDHQRNRAEPEHDPVHRRLHTLVGAGAAEGAVDASNMLKPAGGAAELQCVGASTLNEYRSTSRRRALERRFQTVIVDPRR